MDKAGATVLFEDVSKKANNVGVVVSPTRISSLGEFGTPQFVADKLIQAERRKVCKYGSSAKYDCSAVRVSLWVWFYIMVTSQWHFEIIGSYVLPFSCLVICSSFRYCGECVDSILLFKENLLPNAD